MTTIPSIGLPLIVLSLLLIVIGALHLGGRGPGSVAGNWSGAFPLLLNELLTPDPLVLAGDQPTNTVLVNCHFASIGDLDDAQA